MKMVHLSTLLFHINNMSDKGIDIVKVPYYDIHHKQSTTRRHLPNSPATHHNNHKYVVIINSPISYTS